MNTTKVESYSIQAVCSTASLTIISYALGILLLWIFHPIFGILYFLLCISSLIVSMKLRCCYCYYYGKLCNMGLGKVASRFFKKGQPIEFQNPKKVIPTAIISFGTLLIPLGFGIILIFLDFSLIPILLTLSYIGVAILPNFIIRGHTCEQCMQSGLGCPAYDQMSKSRK
ncbi:hypothetical protein [Candidatus Hodarchaeum mangrovi]